MSLEFERDGSFLVITSKAEAGGEGSEPAVPTDTSLMNALRRSLLNTNPCYAIESKLKDVEIVNRDLGTNLPSSTIFSVPKCNFLPLDDISDRMERQPVGLNSHTKSMLRKRQLYLILAADREDLDKPLVWTQDEPKRLFLRDFEVRSVDRETGEKEWLSPEQRAHLFPYNTHVLNLEKGHIIHCIAPVVQGVGYMDSKFIPCPVRYHYVNPEPKGSELAIPTDRFGNPENIRLVVEYNARKPVDWTVRDSLRYLVKQLRAFKVAYASSVLLDSERDPIAEREAIPDSAVIRQSSVNRSIIIHVFNNVVEFEHDGQLDSAEYLSNETITNLLACHMLYRIMSIYDRAGTEQMMTWLRQTKIAYKKPHPNPRVTHFEIHLQLPNDPVLLEQLDSTDLDGAYHWLLDQTADSLIQFYEEQQERLSRLPPTPDA